MILKIIVSVWTLLVTSCASKSNPQINQSPGVLTPPIELAPQDQTAQGDVKETVPSNEPLEWQDLGKGEPLKFFGDHSKLDHESYPNSPPDAKIRDFRGHPLGNGDRFVPVDVSHKDNFDLAFAKMPQSVDLRIWDNPIQDQRGEELSSAFAIAATMESRIASTTGRRLKLSERQIWAQYHSPYWFVALGRLSGKSLVTESFWPFSVVDPPPFSSLKKGALQTTAKYESRNDLGFIKNTLAVMLYLKEEKALVFVMNDPIGGGISNNDGDPRRGFIRGKVPNKQRTAAPGSYFWKHPKIIENGISGHMMAMVGYKKDPSVGGGGYFILRNNSGDDWGDDGYGYLPFDHCPDHVCVAVSIENIKVIKLRMEE